MNQLKALFFFVLSICSLHTAAQRIKGSDTVLPVSQETAEIFMNTHPEQRLLIEEDEHRFFTLRLVYEGSKLVEKQLYRYS